MVRQLARTTLKTGERMQCLLVEEPEESWAAGVQRLLAHKRDHVHWHIARSIAGPLDALETRFYLGVVGGEAVGNIMTVEHGGIGILGHVFTTPEQRRKGIASRITAALMEDFHARGGRALTLGTGFGTPPYWIYHRFGFRCVGAGSGRMWYWARPERTAELWRAALTGVAPLRWEHWPLLNLLCVQPDGDHLRHAARRIWGQRNLEGEFVAYKRDQEAGKRNVEVRMLENEAGLVVGWASIEDDPIWREAAALLDLFVHPAAAHAAAELFAALTLPARSVFAYAERGSPKIDLLRSHGFTPQSSWPDWVMSMGQKRDVQCWLRR